jgi:uncharacterized protein (TIGR02001 family)
MKNILVPALLATSLLSVNGIAQAQAAESTLAFNVGAVSDYRYRGISQSRLQPAVQGGFDYTDKSGFYVGAWGSTIQWIKDTPGAGKGSVEVDLYGGYKSTVGALAYDVGFRRYEYLKNNYASATGVNANTNEVYGGVTYGVFTAKYSHAVSNLFGNPNSKNSYYLDLSAVFDLGNGMTLTPHVGYQSVKNVANATYSDYALTLAKDLGSGLSATVAVVGTNADEGVYSLKGKYNGKTGAVVGLKYTF